MDTGIGRRGLLGCMAFAGAGIVWTVTGGVPRMLEMASAEAKTLDRLHFVQVSDSHIGFDKDPNHDATATFQAAIAQIGAMKAKPAFLLHTGDITHLSKPAEFDTAAQVADGAGVPVHYIPGEHDWGGDDGALYLERYAAYYT
jgi:Icc protein